MHPQVAGFIFVMCRLCPGPCPQGAVQGGMWLSQEWVSSLGQEDPKGGCRPSLLVEWWVLCMVQSSPVVLIKVPWVGRVSSILQMRKQPPPADKR